MVEQPIGTYTFVFTDIVGSSTLWDQVPESMDLAVARHDTMLREAIHRHGGTVFKSLGDGVAAVFDDPAAALTAMIAAQRNLFAEMWALRSPLRVRIAVQTGPARPRDGDYFGQTVNRVGRLVGVAKGGQIVLSEETARAVADRLPPDVRLVSLGERFFRGMVRPEHVFEVVLADLPVEIDPDEAMIPSSGLPQFAIRRPAQSSLSPFLQLLPSTSSDPQPPFVASYPFPTPDQLIGRRLHLDTLGPILEAGRAARQVVLLGAPAGTGKSALAGAIVQRARWAGALCLVGSAHDDEGVVPLGPFREALADYFSAQPAPEVLAEIRDVANDLATAIPEVRAHLTVTGRPASSPPLDRSQIFDAICVCLRALTDRQPVLLCLEDLHAAGSATLALVQAVVRQMRRRPLTIVATYRTEDLRPGRPITELVAALRAEGAHRIDLQPLGPEQTTALIASLLGGRPSEQLSASLYASTEGNPLFVEQLLLTLREDGSLDRRGSVWHQRGVVAGSIPTVIRDVIGERLARLSDRVRKTLALAAVIGRTVEYRVLLAASENADESALLEDLDEAFGAQILQETQTGWTFSHALVRDVVYADQSTPRRMLLHARVGDAIERLAGSRADERAAELAHHFSLGGRSAAVRTRALNYSMAAGRWASALSAYREALDHFTHACAIIAEDPEGVDRAVRMDALEQAGRASRWVGAWSACADSFSALLAICDDPVRRARARNDIAHAFSATGRTADALAECSAGLTELDCVANGPEALGVRLRLQYDLALLHFLRGEFTRVRALAEEMLHVAGFLGEPTLLNLAHSVMAWAHMALDHVDPAIDQFQRALEASERTGDKNWIAVAHVNIGIENYRGARFAEARPALEQAIRLFREAAGDVRAVNGIQTLGRVWLALGDLAKAEAQARLAESIIATGEHRWAAECHDLRGTIQRLCARWELAEDSFSQAIRIREGVGHRAGLVESLLGLGLVYERRGAWSAAADTYRRALAVAEGMDPSPQHMAAMRQYGRLLLRSGRDEDGATHIVAAHALGESMQQSIEFAPTQLALAELSLVRAPNEAAVLAERVIAGGRTVEVAVEAHALAAHANTRLVRVDTGRRHAAQALELATRLNTSYLLGVAHLTWLRVEAAVGSLAAESAGDAALQHFADARTPYERALTIQVYSSLDDWPHADRERSEQLRREADRLVAGLLFSPSAREAAALTT